MILSCSFKSGRVFYNLARHNLNLLANLGKNYIHVTKKHSSWATLWLKPKALRTVISHFVRRISKWLNCFCYSQELHAKETGSYTCLLYEACFLGTFAYNRTNYCPYLSAYYVEMLDLPKIHPDVNKFFGGGILHSKTRGSWICTSRV